jgi:pilus assembly protein CpaC
MGLFEKAGLHKGGTMTAKRISALLVTAALYAGLPLPMATTAHSTDVGASEESGGQFARIGLNKSIVVKLPGNARDVIVGNAEVVDAVVRSKNTAYLFGKNIGQTNVFFFDANGEQILALDLEVAIDTVAVQKVINRAMPGNKIKVDSAGEHLILMGSGTPGDAKMAEELARRFIPEDSANDGRTVINSIKMIGEDQVMLKVKVVEIQRDILKQIGVDFQALMQMGQTVFNLASVNPFNSALLSPRQGLGITDNVGNQRLDAVIRAMEGDGMLRLLAEPNVTAVSGKEAKFHAGGEFPFQVCDFSGSRRVCDIKFKEFGVNLDFIPVVVSDGRISLKLRSEVSELSSVFSGDQSVPSINTRKTQTTVELPSGGSMMIAGLIRESTRQNINGTPGLKKLPILGNLFRSREFIANETELVVIVTPYLVKASHETELVTPDKNFNASTDRQSFFFGRLNKKYGTTGKAPHGSYNGNVGYIFE